MKPYRAYYHDGFWYFVKNEEDGGIIITMQLTLDALFKQAETCLTWVRLKI